MRGFLLDTHIWIWSLLDPERIVPAVADVLEAADSELWLSPISVWETAMLAEKGRIILNQPTAHWLCTALKQAPINEAQVTFEVAAAVGGIVLPHRDPADRFLLATAEVYELTLITADRRLLDQKAIPTLANR